MYGYYAERLSAERLRQCYEIASPRVRQYLEAEIRFVLDKLHRSDEVLELGCGYGRVTLELARLARRVVGIDTSRESIDLARRLAGEGSRCKFLEMDAVDLRFPPAAFDIVACVQNGVCAFGVNQESLVREALRVTRPGGLVLFSTYAESFWPHRLVWFEAQAAAGLLGEIDHEKTRDGTIACKDSFRAGFLTPEELRRLCAMVGIEPTITEVDGSSVFCALRVASAPPPPFSRSLSCDPPDAGLD
jgi:2-polyprenyl-6-hydroxyphenyl methylase/3-demethylubiquinone-9 3-methyltransferase